MTQQYKVLLREKILSQRKSLSSADFQEKNQQICDRIKSWKIFCEAKTILAYFSFRQEPDLMSLITNQKKWGFPCCVGSNLLWYSWQPGDAISSGKYGIKEPLQRELPIVATEVDLIIVPTVACDHSGYRLGYGGGYYDRLLTSPQWQNCPTLGIVFDFSYMENLPRDSWDIKLQYICTEFFLDECGSV